ncbi:Uncharacterised protein [Raoultella planticola]|uniref:Uncharacterized protein n=1 Tax=Raoultella planticola TaxID=575 RepID=A0A485A410_RAOPL|nr:Uncharacterised protein [Raoultella planticola]
MSSLSIRLFTLFREEHPVRDALVLFTITLLLHFFGAMLRLVQELSFFWPLNAVMVGIFARYVWLNRSYFYATCFGGDDGLRRPDLTLGDGLCLAAD